MAELIIFGILVIIFLIYILGALVYNSVNKFFMYRVGRRRLYLFEKIPGHGDILKELGWFECDEDAMKSRKGIWADFISEDYPDKGRRIKPKN